MAGFLNLKDLIKTLDWGRDLLSEMFEKRKSFAYKYDHAIELLEEARVEALIQKGIIRQNGPYLELDEQFLDFFEQVLEVNEEINTSYITEQIQQIRQHINFYLQEGNEIRRYGYLKAVKAALRKTGRIILRNIIDLNRNIENTFKAEPSYVIKLAKLESFDEKRRSVSALLEQTEVLVTEEEKTFFTTASDVELRHLVNQLRMQLTEARHNLIETQRQIIEYLNQVKHQNRVIEKVKQLKYLKDQFELTHKSNLRERLVVMNAVLFEPKTPFSFKLSLDLLQSDDCGALIKKVANRMNLDKKAARPVAEAIAEDLLHTESEDEIYINLEEIKQGFLASGHHLFAYVMQYRYPRVVSYEEKVTIYCQMVGMYENDMEVIESYQQQDLLEYAIVKPR
jgi:hypothetical protein